MLPCRVETADLTPDLHRTGRKTIQNFYALLAADATGDKLSVVFPSHCVSLSTLDPT